MSRITVTYSATADLVKYQGDRENICLSVEIDSFDDYADTLELLRSKVMEKLDIKKQYADLQRDYSEIRKKFVEVTKQLESANKQWELVSKFLEAQGLKTDTAEFPREALTNLSKSLPASVSGYPE